jgi:hypothetical protein
MIKLVIGHRLKIARPGQAGQTGLFIIGCFQSVLSSDSFIHAFSHSCIHALVFMHSRIAAFTH